MENPFPSFPPDSRLWIFQSERKLTGEEQTFTQETLGKFLNDWKSHGKQMQASSRILFDFFILVALDDHTGPEASGCGIDALTTFIQKIGREIQVSFTNNSNIAVMKQIDVQIHPFPDLIKQLKNGAFTGEEYIFNNTITSIRSIESSWIIAINNSWLKKYLAPIKAES